MTEERIKKLKLCPFCGSNAYIWPVPGYVQSSTFKVSCMKDCVSMPVRHDTFFTSQEEAAKAWNHRDPAEVREEGREEGIEELLDAAEQVVIRFRVEGHGDLRSVIACIRDEAKRLKEKV